MSDEGAGRELVTRHSSLLTRPVFYVLVGVPGSGKSTYARTYLAEAMRISLDDLRLMLSGQTFELRAEPAVAVAAEALLQSLPPYCASKGWDLVFDATNVTRARRAPLIAIARQHGFKPVAIFFTGSLVVAMKRNAARPHPVPTVAVLNFARRLDPPSLEEGFEEVVVIDSR